MTDTPDLSHDPDACDLCGGSGVDFDAHGNSKPCPCTLMCGTLCEGCGVECRSAPLRTLITPERQ